MKKHISVAALTLRLTWVRALGLFAAVGVLQWLLTPDAGTMDGYQDYIRNAARIGRGGILVLLILMVTSLGGSQTSYTWRRLRIPEGRATVISGLVISGWFFLYWAFQLAACLVLYSRYNELHQFGTEYLMLSAFREDYLHFLLPIGEPWAIIRNVVLFLLMGNLASQAARRSRNGNTYGRGFFYSMFILLELWQGGELASQRTDIWGIVCGILLTIGIWDSDRRWMKHEAP